MSFISLNRGEIANNNETSLKVGKIDLNVSIIDEVVGAEVLLILKIA